jgi:hypothetical protein
MPLVPQRETAARICEESSRPQPWGVMMQWLPWEVSGRLVVFMVVVAPR